MKLSFRFLPLCIAMALLLIGGGLATWQLDRAKQKNALAAERAAMLKTTPIVLNKLDPQGLPASSRVMLSGEWLGERSVLLDNRMYQGRPGYHVLTPLRLDNGQIVLVNRGWVAALRLRKDLPSIVVPEGKVDVLGIMRLPPKVFMLSDKIYEGNVWEKMDFDAYREWSKLDITPVLIQQWDGPEDGLIRDWTLPPSGAAMHYGYAVMWLAIGIAGASVTLAAARRKSV